MDIDAAEEYLRLGIGGKRMRKRALQTLAIFIDSFENETEVDAWVWRCLRDPQTPIDRLVNDFVVFEELVFPALKRGYERGDLEASIRLGLENERIFRSKKLRDVLPENGIQILKRCYKRDPSNRQVRAELLRFSVNWLGHCLHEWPEMVIYGMNGATLEQCKEIRAEVQNARSLDLSHNYNDFLARSDQYLEEYEARLVAASN